MAPLVREVVGDVLRLAPDFAGPDAARSVRFSAGEPRVSVRGGARAQGAVE